MNHPISDPRYVAGLAKQMGGGSRGMNVTAVQAKTFQPKQHSVDKLLSKMNLSHGAAGELARSIKETETSRFCT